MPFDQTITIINNSGKIISTGKHLVGIFKEARSAYREKKDALRREKSGSLRHANTFHGPSGRFDRGAPFVEEPEEGDGFDERAYGYRGLANTRQTLFLEGGGRLSQDDSSRYSHVSSQSRNPRSPPRSSSVGGSSHRSRPHHGRDRPSDNSLRPSRPLLTERNLRTHSEVSSTTPSSLPMRPRRDDRIAPYDHAALSLETGDSQPQLPVRVQVSPTAPDIVPAAFVSAPRMSMMANRPKSDPSLRESGPKQPIDMHLAYGDMPPDLGSRFDLDPQAADGERQKEAKVKTLIDYIESVLDEAQCIHHTAASIIAHLQDSPEAAAAVALTLAELSALLAKLSPAFLGVVKGGSPAVFALLASPQFLIGTSIAVGITVVAFGGWKIVKRITDGRQAFEVAGRSQGSQQYEPIAGQSAAAAAATTTPTIAGAHPHSLLPAAERTAPTVVSDRFDEALVLEEELSTIESWRRGIVPPPDYEDSSDLERAGEAVDAELISPEAMRSRIGDDDVRTLRSVRTHLTNRSRATNNSHRSSRSHHHSRRHHHDSAGATGEAGKSSKDSATADSHSSVGPGHRSRRSDSHAGKKAKSGSTISASTAPLTSPQSDLGTRGKDKKDNSGGNMLKQLFKKKREKEDKNRDDTYVSVLVR